MNRLSEDKRVKIIQLLVEGNSLRSCARITDTSITTVSKLLVDVDKACLKFHSNTVVQIRADRVQCDEIWSFVGCKQKNVKSQQYGIGDVWTWVGMDSDTKLIISWFVGERSMQAAKFFMNDLWCRLRTRVQLTTDGLYFYREAVDDTFGSRIDFAQLVKQYSTNSVDLNGKIDRREKYVGADRIVITGNPDKKYISTSHLERQNLTMRMSIRRFTRKTNAFSKKIENHCYAVAINFVYYNFVRIHQTLRVTPAMAAKLTNRFMTLTDLVRLSECQEKSN